MIPIYVDAALLAFTNGLAESENELALLIDRVVSLSTWAQQCSAIMMVKPFDLEGRLEAAGSFPSFDTIRDTLQSHGLTEIFSTRDVLLSLLAIIERAHSASELFGLDVSRASIDETPLSTIFDRFPSIVREHSVCTLAAVCMLQLHKKVSPNSFAISGHPLLRRQRLPFSCKVEEVVVKPPKTICTPSDISGIVNLVDSPVDIVEGGNALQIWKFAEDAKDIHVAIEARIREIMSSDPSLVRGIKKYSLGTEFIPSLQHNQAMGSGQFASTVLDVCARVIIGIPKYDINDFGERTSDHAQGRRTHATKHRPALRLLFWVRVDGEIEFANIGQKNDLEIEDGDPMRRVLVQYPL